MPKAIRSLVDKLGSRGSRPEELEPEYRLRSYEPMTGMPLPGFESETAPEPPAIQDSARLRAYYEALRELAHAVSTLADRDHVSHTKLFIDIDRLIARQVAEVTDLAPPIMTLLTDSPDWRERRWAMQVLVKLARQTPDIAGTVVPGYLVHVESPVATEHDLESLRHQPSRERLAKEFGFGDAVLVDIELPIPVGEHLQEVALEGLDQLALILPDLAQEAFPVLEALADQPTKAGERAAKLLERMRLGERMRRMLITEEFLAALRKPYVIAVARGKKYHDGGCRTIRPSVGKDAYLFLNPQEAVEFGFSPCQACQAE